MGKFDLSAYELASLSEEPIDNPKDLPAIPSGHFRVVYERGNVLHPTPFRDVLTSKKVRVISEELSREGERIVRKAHLDEVDALAFWTRRSQKPGSRIVGILGDNGKGKAAKSTGAKAPVAPPPTKPVEAAK